MLWVSNPDCLPNLLVFCLAAKNMEEMLTDFLQQDCTMSIFHLASVQHFQLRVFNIKSVCSIKSECLHFLKLNLYLRLHNISISLVVIALGWRVCIQSRMNDIDLRMS